MKFRISFNRQFFDIINTQEKAYFLGLLYADGCNYEKGSVLLSLRSSDIDILNRFKSSIEYSGTIKEHVKTYTSNGQKLHSKASTLLLCGKEFSASCLKQGVLYNKSFTLKFPTSDQVPDYLVHHFVRGYFDGDGSISFDSNKSKRMYCNIVGSAAFILALHNKLHDIGIIGCSYPHANGRTMYIGINGNLQCERFLDWLYSGSTVCLKRKFDKYLDFKSKRKLLSKRTGSKSQFFGVTPTGDGTWKAISPLFNGIQKYLKAFKTEEQAAIAYDIWCVENQHDLHRLNFPIENYKVSV